MNTKYDWSSVPKDIVYLTTDEHGNIAGWVGKAYKPSIFGSLWYGADYETGEPKYYKIKVDSSVNDWQDSLEERPQ